VGRQVDSPKTCLGVYNILERERESIRLLALVLFCYIFLAFHFDLQPKSKKRKRKCVCVLSKYIFSLSKVIRKKGNSHSLDIYEKTGLAFFGDFVSYYKIGNG
jgi:hypothetical protein